MGEENFLFVSARGSCADLAWRIRQEGHAVRMFIEDPAQADVGDGFVDKTKDWRAEVGWAGVIVFDGIPGTAEPRRQGKAVIGGEEPAHIVSLVPHRSYGRFDLEDAVRFVHDNPGRYVVKPVGSAPIFVGEDEAGEDVQRVLRSYRDARPDIDEIQIQRRMDGLEVGVGGFFDGKDFVLPFCITFQSKRFFPGDLGPLTDGMGIGVCWVGSGPIFDRTLAPLRDKLVEQGYRGFVEIACRVQEDEIDPLEITAHLGYTALLAVPAGEFLANLARGKTPEVRVKKRFQLGVRVVTPPYPYRDEQTFRALSRNAPIRFTGKVEGVHIEDVKKVEGEWRVAGSAGAVLTMIGNGDTARQAQRRAYRTLGNVRIPSMYYRNDIGARWPEDLDRLREWGWLVTAPRPATPRARG